MNKISIEVGGMKIDCEESAFSAVFKALSASGVANIGVDISKGQGDTTKAQEEVNKVTISTAAAVTDSSPVEKKSALIKYMDRWNRIHSKDVSVRGRRFSDSDRKLLHRIATAARDESASIAWVAHTCRVCPASIHRALTWNDQE